MRSTSGLVVTILEFKEADAQQKRGVSGNSQDLLQVLCRTEALERSKHVEATYSFQLQC